MHKHLLLVVIFLSGFATGCAQGPVKFQRSVSDTFIPQQQLKRVVAKNGYLPDRSNRKKAFVRSTYVAIPLIVLGIYNNDDDGFINKYEIREDRNEHVGNFHTSADDYLQFAPIATVYALNAIGIKGKHDIWNQTALLIKSELIMNAIVVPFKKYSKVIRPDGSNYHAFPSGHTAQAFLSAEFLRKEYGKKYPLLAIGGYFVATSVGAMRILNNRHWITDVITGAGIGILSANLAYLSHRNKWPLWKKKIQFIPTYNGTSTGIYINYQLSK